MFAAVRIERGATLTGLDRLDTGMIVDGELRILFADRRVLSLLERREGIMASGGKLLASSRHMAMLQSLVQKICSAAMAPPPRAGGGVPLPRIDKRPLWVLVCHHPSQSAAALILIRDPEFQNHAAPAILRQLFGLTQAEAALAAALTDEQSLTEVSEARNTSPHTLRTQLKSIMSKTGTNRQSELQALILRSVAILER